MNLNHPELQPQDLFDIRTDVPGVSRVKPSAGNQALGISFYVIGNELIHAGGETDHVGRDVVNQDRAIDASLVQVVEEGRWRATELKDSRKVRPALFHELKSIWPEHVKRLDVNMTVSNQAGHGPLVDGAEL
jgi:hypothetical protein